MTGKQVLDLAGAYLQEEEILRRETGTFLPLLDSVLQEICAEYFPLRRTEEQTSGGEIPLSALRRRALSVLKVERKGKRIPFLLNPFSVACEAGPAQVTYTYLPEPVLGEDSELELSPCVTERAVALGFAAAYSLSRNLYEQAAMYDRKFRESLSALAPRRGIRLPEWEL